jgi:conjugative transfer signal peptidase TraF
MTPSARLSAVAMALSAVVLIAGYGFGVRVNTSPSVPVGLYWAAPTVPKVGDTVMICPPDTAAFQLARERGFIGRGNCPGRFEYLFKRLLAAKNDVVSIGRDGITVNGELIPSTQPRVSDGQGRPLPVIVYGPAPLGAGEVLFVGDNDPTSFDARYFGPIPSSQIVTAVRPLWTW